MSTGKVQNHGNSAGATADWVIQHTHRKNSDQPEQKNRPVSNERRCSSHAWADGWDQAYQALCQMRLLYRRKKQLTRRRFDLSKSDEWKLSRSWLTAGAARAPTALYNTPRDASFPRYVASGDRVSFNDDGRDDRPLADPAHATRKCGSERHRLLCQTRPNTRCLDRVTYKLFRSWVPPIKGGVCLDRGCGQCALLENGASGHVSTCDLH
ncbi:hypothetical protein EDB87DRAFT_448810 [Lactarius vividus]|nr:hypothetical protein EDB87DRAFT_448810 [Lactarius vividus]